MYQWDIGTRSSGVIDFRGGQLEVKEFAFDEVSIKVIYDENDVDDSQYPGYPRPWTGQSVSFSSGTE